jgi:gliding motility-associated-like protein
VLANPLASTTYVLVVSEGRCSDTVSSYVGVHPPVEAGFDISQPGGCGALEVKFNDRSQNGVTTVWDFGDGSGLNNSTDPIHVYTTPGNYRVRLIVIGTGGCRDTLDSEVNPQLTEALTAIIVSNPILPNELLLPNAEVKVEETNTRSTRWLWDFGDGTSAQTQTTTHSYGTAGTYYIRVETQDAAGCKAQQIIGPVMVKTPELEIPNVFTPNQDGNNDIFYIKHIIEGDYYLQIIDRWGVLHFESRNASQGWNGLNLQGVESPQGVYFYTLKSQFGLYQGSLNLLR